MSVKVRFDDQTSTLFSVTELVDPARHRSAARSMSCGQQAEGRLGLLNQEGRSAAVG